MLRASVSSHRSKFTLLVHLTAWFTRNAAGLLSAHTDDVSGEGSLRKESEVCTGAPYSYLAVLGASSLGARAASDSVFNVKPVDVFTSSSKLLSSGTPGSIKDNAGL